MESSEPVEKDYTLLFCRRHCVVVPALAAADGGGAAGEAGDSSATCSIGSGREVMLGMKKRGFGAGRWNGFGGKVDPGESYEDAAIRELQEESGVLARRITRRGFLVFFLEDRNIYMKVHVYECWDFEGDGEETEEMRPRWFPEAALPLDQMWPDDRYWLPSMLENERKSFIGRFDYSDDDTITSHSLVLQ